MVNLAIPDAYKEALVAAGNGSPPEAGDVVRAMVAVKLYELEMLGPAPAAALAGLDRVSFEALLDRWSRPVFDRSNADLEAEIDTARAYLNRGIY